MVMAYLDEGSLNSQHEIAHIPYSHQDIPKGTQRVVFHQGVEISMRDSSISNLEKCCGGCPLWFGY